MLRCPDHGRMAVTCADLRGDGRQARSRPKGHALESFSLVKSRRRRRSPLPGPFERQHRPRGAPASSEHEALGPRRFGGVRLRRTVRCTAAAVWNGYVRQASPPGRRDQPIALSRTSRGLRWRAAEGTCLGPRSRNPAERDSCARAAASQRAINASELGPSDASRSRRWRDARSAAASSDTAIAATGEPELRATRTSLRGNYMKAPVDVSPIRRRWALSRRRRQASFDATLARSENAVGTVSPCAS